MWSLIWDWMSEYKDRMWCDVMAHFKNKFSIEFDSKYFSPSPLQGLMLLLQNFPTQHWKDEEMRMILAEAYRLKFSFADAPKHFVRESAPTRGAQWLDDLSRDLLPPCMASKCTGISMTENWFREVQRRNFQFELLMLMMMILCMRNISICSDPITKPISLVRPFPELFIAANERLRLPLTLRLDWTRVFRCWAMNCNCYRSVINEHFQLYIEMTICLCFKRDDESDSLKPLLLRCLFI